ncbi:hypothetical protein AWU67_07465 [Microterricola viridarii]|uniref:Uncharacterized protein n=1 Tax=Microterricola viridarii TaxID=412690 RepID=A0A0X8E2X9_9MICO|nr:hypothetical protein AWU67_07465 [Microterricola viridarii]
MILVASGLLAVLTGCAQGPDPRIVRLNDVLDELELSSISEIACDFTRVPGFINPSGSVHKRLIGLEGAGHAEEAVERLLAAGFTSVDERGGVLEFSGEAGMRASVAVVAVDSELSGTEVNIYGSYSCTYPETGMTAVVLTLK